MRHDKNITKKKKKKSNPKKQVSMHMGNISLHHPQDVIQIILPRVPHNLRASGLLDVNESIDMNDVSYKISIPQWLSNMVLSI
jgi:hypothetical protein